MPTPQMSDYPEALRVFEDNNLEVELELRSEDNEAILKLREAGSYRWNNRRSIPLSKLPDPSDKEAVETFWGRMWHNLQIYPKIPANYSISSDAVWIPIQEKKPDNNQPVLAYGEPPISNGRKILPATYRASASERYASTFDYVTDDFRTVTLSNVTHWLPMPEPPRRS